MQTEGGLVNMLKLFNLSSHHVVCDGIIRQKSEASPDKNAQFHPIVWKTCPPAADSLHSQVKSLIRMQGCVLEGYYVMGRLLYKSENYFY